MAGGIRINKFASESGVGVNTIIETLKKFGVTDELSQNSKIPDEMYERLAKEFKLDIQAKNESEKIVITTKGNKDKDSVSIGNEGIVSAEETKHEPLKGPKILGKIDLTPQQRGGKAKNEQPKPQKPTAETPKKAEEKPEPAPEQKPEPAPVEPTNAIFCPGFAYREISFKIVLSGL